MDSITGAVTLTANPDFETKSSYTFTVVATDAAGNASEKPVTLNIGNVNEAPTVKSGAPASATFVSGQHVGRLNLEDVFSDVDAGDTLTFSSGTLPIGLSLANGIVSGSTTDAGNTVRFTATDRAGLAVSKDILLNVVSKPVVTSIAVADAEAGSTTPAIGKSGDVVKLEVTLSETVTASGAALAAANISATFTAGGTALTAVSFQSSATVNNQTVLTFTGTPAIHHGRQCQQRAAHQPDTDKQPGSHRQHQWQCHGRQPKRPLHQRQLHAGQQRPQHHQHTACLGPDQQQRQPLDGRPGHWQQGGFDHSIGRSPH